MHLKKRLFHNINTCPWCVLTFKILYLSKIVKIKDNINKIYNIEFVLKIQHFTFDIQKIWCLNVFSTVMIWLVFVLVLDKQVALGWCYPLVCKKYLAVWKAFSNIRQTIQVTIWYTMNSFQCLLLGWRRFWVNTFTCGHKIGWDQFYRSKLVSRFIQGQGHRSQVSRLHYM